MRGASSDGSLRAVVPNDLLGLDAALPRGDPWARVALCCRSGCCVAVRGCGAATPGGAHIAALQSRCEPECLWLICAAATDACGWGVGRRSLRDAISRHSDDFI